MDRDDFIITVYCLVCEHYHGIAATTALRRGGFAPALRDEEVMTMEICGEYFKLATDRLPVSKTAGSESRRPRRSFSSAAAAGSRPSHADRASGATTLRSSLADSNPRDSRCPCAPPNRVDYSTGHHRSRGSYRRTDPHNGHGRALPHASPGDPRADGDAPLRCKTASESLRVCR
jgi:hypothetical protein